MPFLLLPSSTSYRGYSISYTFHCLLRVTQDLIYILFSIYFHQEVLALKVLDNWYCFFLKYADSLREHGLVVVVADGGATQIGSVGNPLEHTCLRDAKVDDRRDDRLVAHVVKPAI